MSRKGSTATFGGGLNQDVDPVQIPDGDYLFALNAQSDGGVGEKGVISSELGTKIASAIPKGYILIGHCYMREGEIALFLVNPDEKKGSSQIGIFDVTGKYTSHVNFKGLKFRVDNPIECIFRIRKGCERTIYWVEKNGGNPPRYYVFEKPEHFKDDSGRWNERQFLLQKSYNRPPTITHVGVLNGGTIEAGSYSFAIQLIDENLNKSEWIFSTGRINVYHHDQSRHYPHLHGSINSNHDPIKFGKTNKAIEIKITDLDASFRYYRLAIIRSISNNGTITDILVTGEIDISIDKFIYNGSNTIGKISQAELLQDNNLYDGAQTIEQKDNRLILGNVSRLNINWCRLQYYASRITADCILKRISLDSVWDVSNPKNPIVDLGNTGYMPGEIYSFGIVYIFEGGIKSPVYHIPGKPKYVRANTIFSPGRNVHPMSNNNVCESKYYISPQRGFNYWGNDSQGKPLEGNVVRHHRFPRRDELNLPLVHIQRSNTILRYKALKMIIKGRLDYSYVKPIIFKLSYTHNQEYMELSLRIVPATYDNRETDSGATTKDITAEIVGRERTTDEQSQYENIKLSYAIGQSEFVELEQEFSYTSTTNITLKTANESNPDELVDYPGFSNVVVSFSERVNQTSVGRKKVTTDIFGIKFGNIDIPSKDDTNGYKCIGYYIVRNDRTEDEKTVIDTGILFPTTDHEGYVAFGLPNYQSRNNTIHSGPEENYWSSLKGPTNFLWREYNKMFALYYPQMQFYDRRINDITRIRQIGSLKRVNDKYGLVLYNDVADGSSLDGTKLGDWLKTNDDIEEKDGNRYIKDGYCLAIYSRDRDVDYLPYKNGFIFNKSDIYNTYYMNAMGHITSRGKEVYNLAANQRICLIEPHSEKDIFGGNNADWWAGYWQWPRPMFVAIERDNSSPYYKFDALPYYSDTMNMQKFLRKEDNYTVVFGGDSYVCPIREAWLSLNTIHQAVRIKDGWKAFWKMFAGALLVVGGIIAAVFTGGSSLVLAGLGLSIAGVGALLTKSGIDTEKTKQIWREEYDKGLRQCVNDRYYATMLGRGYIQSDYLQMATMPDLRNDLDIKFENGSWHPVDVVLGENGFSDDTFIWNAECISDLYLESSINISLRNKFANDSTPTFMVAPSQDGDPNNDMLMWWGIKSKGKKAAYVDAIHSRYERNDFERYAVSCLLGYDGTRQDNRKYLGIPLPTYKYVNVDYMTKHKIKAFFTIPRDYDCLSQCQNVFPNRLIWSNVSNEENNEDGYRTILPNNYVDMNASAGDIKRIISYNNELHVFTSEALWKVPNTLQERVNDGVVTFIGSGEFLSVPARRIVDSNTGVGGGCIHSFSIIKTPYGLCYVSYTDRRVYLLQGNTLKPISDIGMSSWFKENIRIITDEDYFKNNTKIYRFRDNTFASIGTGFALGYDNLNNRLLVSKKDRVVFSNRNGYIITTDGNERYIFYDYENTIDNYVSQGWEYLGITGIKMRFRRFKENTGAKTVKVKKTRKVQKVIREPQDIFKAADILLIRYTIIRNPGQGTGGGLDTRSQILDPDDLMEHPVGWYDGKPEYYTRKIDKYWAYGGDWKPDSNANSFGGTDVFAINLGNIRKDRPGIESVSWNCAAYWFTPANGSKVKLVFTTYKGGELGFGDDYTLTVTGGQKLGEFDHPDSQGREVTDGFHEQSQVPFEQMTYLGKFQYNINTGTLYDITNPKDSIEVGKDGSGTTTVMVEKTVEEEEEYYDNETLDNNKLVPDFMEITADPLTDKVVDNSWTASYSFGKNRWISFHSYLPNTYITTADKIFSMIDNNRNIYEHNILGKYNSYYDQKQQHILEFVCKTESMLIGVFDSITLNTDALRFNNNAFYDARLITFNKAILYNGRQCSGVLELRPKQDSISDYIYNISNNNPLDVSSIERREKDWNINEFSDIRTNYDTHIWSSYLIDRQNNYFIDKVLNFGSLDYNKHWTELERFRDRYIIIRLIFDTHDDVRLITRMCSTNIVY